MVKLIPQNGQEACILNVIAAEKWEHPEKKYIHIPAHVGFYNLAFNINLLFFSVFRARRW